MCNSTTCAIGAKAGGTRRRISACFAGHTTWRRRDKFGEMDMRRCMSRRGEARTCAGACWVGRRRGRVASAWERRWSGVRAWPRKTLRAVSPLSGPMDSSWTAWRSTRPSLGDDARPQPDHRPLENPPGFPQRLGKPLGAVSLWLGPGGGCWILGGGWVLGLNMRRGMFVASGGSGCAVVQARASPGLPGRRHFKPGLGCRSGLNTQARGLELSAQEMEIE